MKTTRRRQRKPMKAVLGLFVMMFVASTASLAMAAAEIGDRPGATLTERSASAVSPRPHTPWIGQSPRFGVRIVVLSGTPLDLNAMDTLVEAVSRSAGVSPASAETVQIGIVPDPQLQKIAAAIGIPEEVLSIRQGSQILLTEELLASGRALTEVLANNLVQAFSDPGTSVKVARFGR
ncbi:MAG: hypothetical protein HYV08_12685 [Deltaproteobacteria bacterium]|nr:hypothetical protein [Deltaproteobacteria bacterium]MBI3078901.1 hypothetical protein [Deltaproteobacteria bacterium]